MEMYKNSEPMLSKLGCNTFKILSNPAIISLSILLHSLHLNPPGVQSGSN